MNEAIKKITAFIIAFIIILPIIILLKSLEFIFGEAERAVYKLKNKLYKSIGMWWFYG